MNRILIGIICILGLFILVGCGPSYNEFIEKDIEIIKEAIQVEIDSTLCVKYNMDLQYKAINIWCPDVIAGYKMVGSRIESRILEGIKDKPIEIYLYFEQSKSDDYDTYTIQRD